MAETADLTLLEDDPFTPLGRLLDEKENMTRLLLRSILLLTLLVLSGCAHKLSGPIHSADGPGWVTDAEVTSAPTDVRVHHRIVLIGDAGYFLEDDPTLAALDQWATSVDSSTVVFLGDNIYNEGLTDEDRENGERVLGQQLSATAVPKIAIPGNHDWGLLPKNYNAKSIQNQQAFVDGWPQGNAEFIPKNGCMGPTARVLRERSEDQQAVVFIAVDPTPWINEGIREACPDAMTQEAHLAALDALLSLHTDDQVIMASHYPMLTGGPHGGLSYGFLVDMIITPLGWMMGGLLNTYETDYADWITRSQEVMRRNPPAIYAAGHDHNLQLLRSGDVAGMYVVSGAGARARVSTVTNIDETIFAHAAEGFIVVDFGQTESGKDAVVLRVIEPLVSVDKPVFETALD